MKKPDTPKTEIQRLFELNSFNILDTPTQIEYDEITLLASTICKTPIALVSLIDEDRQWFKSHHGLEASETPRDISFCGHAINQDDLFEINNALEDERFSDNPLATGEPRVIFYAGQPLISSKGNNLGTLCVIDHESRELNQEQKEAMKVLAKHVITQMEYELSNTKLKDSLYKIKTQKEELIESSKLKTLGIMAGGIAHEINNPLGIISLYSKQMMKSIEKDKFTKEELINSCKSIENTVVRISNIIKALKNISRDSSQDDVEEVKLSEILDDVLMLCHEKSKDTGITIDLISKIKTDTVFFSPGQLAQVLMNLVSNSVDAIENQKEKWIKLTINDVGENIKISCTDSGKSIDSDNAKNMMDPFFTTKAPGKGTGLGLSISQKIMSRNNGSLTYDKDSQFTKFDVLVPKSKSLISKG